MISVRPDTYREAYESGFTDGVDSGRKDWERRGPFDFASNLSYQDANRGFRSDLHDRDVYVVAYRRGFEDGYGEGYGLGGGAKVSATAGQPLVSTEGVTQQGQEGHTHRLLIGTRIHIRLLETLSTQRNERGDRFRAEVLRDVLVGEEIAVPAGSAVSGTITHLKRAGRIRGRSEMNLHFDAIELPSGVRVPLAATVASIEQRADEEVKDEEGVIEGKSGTSRDVKRVGAATGIGALIGILAGGGKGAKVGAAVGLATGAAGVLATRGSDIVLYPDTELTIQLEREAVFSQGILRRSR
jgi:type IV secretion system protein VirB10